jgi:hypothetical protein
MLEGICPKCGCCYVGWALRFPRNQTCSNCGAALEIYEDGKRISTGYSPFNAEKYSINLPDDDTTSQDEEKKNNPQIHESASEK